MIQGDEMKDNNCCGVKLQDIRRSQISDLMRFDRNCINSRVNRDRYLRSYPQFMRCHLNYFEPCWEQKKMCQGALVYQI